MDTLHQSVYDVNTATSRLVPRGPVLCADELESWTQGLLPLHHYTSVHHIVAPLYQCTTYAAPLYQCDHIAAPIYQCTSYCSTIIPMYIILQHHYTSIHHIVAPVYHIVLPIILYCCTEEAKRFEEGLQDQKDFLYIQRRYVSNGGSVSWSLSCS